MNARYLSFIFKGWGRLFVDFALERGGGGGC